MNRINLFRQKPQFKITKPIRLIELFAGIGAQAKALENLDVAFEHYKICEINEKSVKSYNAIHGTTFHASDISKICGDDLEIVDTDTYDYIMTYSFPCVDLSTAGYQLGMSRNSATRSGLLWEVERLLKECKNLPQILLMENVVQVHSYANKNDFSEWCSFLRNLGYTNYISDLSAENFDVPQSRIRCFMISILNDNFNYQFPNFVTKTRNLYDFLQKRCSVNDFILNDFGKYIVSKFVNSDIFRYYTLNNGNKVEKLNIYISDTDSDVDVVHMCTCSGSIKKDINVNNDDTTKQRIFVRSSEYCGTLTTFCKDNIIIEVYELLSDNDDNFCFRDFVYSFENKRYVVLIRYLTPLECFRLMGFSDFDYEAVKNIGTSKDTMYFQTGNSIVVDVLYNIFKRML